MRLLNYFKKQIQNNSANIARERLQIIISNKSNENLFNNLKKLEKNIIYVLSKYIYVHENQIQIRSKRIKNNSIIEFNVKILNQDIIKEKKI